MSDSNRTLVMLATYNEAGHVEDMAKALLQLPGSPDILFVDDNSPDGTGELIDRIAALNPRVKVIHRPGKMGVGSAHLDGINYAYENNYPWLLTMDCDFTHSPDRAIDFLAARGKADIITGTRFQDPKSLEGWNPWRKALTHFAHLLTSIALSMPYDASGAFRLYRLSNIDRRVFNLTRNPGYSFFWESMFLLTYNGSTVREIPIMLPARVYGDSKMRFKDVVNGLTYLANVACRKWFKPQTLRPFLGKRENSPEEWDRYWQKAGRGNTGLYQRLAGLYRHYLIEPYLWRVMSKHLKADAEILHAGCGGGEVDKRLVDNFKVSAIDISAVALNHYSDLHGNKVRAYSGSIMAMPFAENQFDCVYNLGVMEHFTPHEIKAAFNEFNRVLRPGGKVIIFWPPKYGFSVLVFRLIHFVLNSILRRNTYLHPDEPGLLQSRAQAFEILEEAGFSPEAYHFGPGDMFTQVALVGVKK